MLLEIRFIKINFSEICKCLAQKFCKFKLDKFYLWNSLIFYLNSGNTVNSICLYVDVSEEKICGKKFTSRSNK